MGTAALVVGWLVGTAAGTAAGCALGEWLLRRADRREALARAAESARISVMLRAGLRAIYCRPFE